MKAAFISSNIGDKDNAFAFAADRNRFPTNAVDNAEETHNEDPFIRRQQRYNMQTLHRVPTLLLNVNGLERLCELSRNSDRFIFSSGHTSQQTLACSIAGCSLGDVASSPKSSIRIRIDGFE